MEQEKKTLDILQVKEILLKQIGTIAQEERSNATIPEIVLSQEEIQITFASGKIHGEILLQCVEILSSSLENWRISSIETGYMALQAPSTSGYDTKYGLDSLRIRFTLYPSKCNIFVSKRGEMSTPELLSIFGLYRFLSSLGKSETKNPTDILVKLGATVYDPIEEELKGEKMGFERIAGYGGVKREIQETIIYPLKHPEVFDNVSLLTKKFISKNKPRAILFEGSPGVGKTSMAKVVSAECRIPLVYVPIESILSKYYGESSQNLAMVFDAASLFPNCLLFLDEIDSLAGKRDDGMFDANRKLLSVLLRKLDGFEAKTGTITIGATNRKGDLDSALLSRFDKAIYFPLPNQEEIVEILYAYALQIELDDRRTLAHELVGMSGRNIRDFCDSVERRWSTELVIFNQPIQAPPFSFYMECIKIRGLKIIDS